MIEPQQLIRRHDRIRAVWQRTKSTNTAERCRLRLASIAREARENFDHAHARAVGARMVLRLPDDRARVSSLANAGDEPRPLGAVGSGPSFERP
jgi:hypothetical protein